MFKKLLHKNNTMKHTYTLFIALLMLTSACSSTDTTTEDIKTLIATNDMKAIAEKKNEISKKHKDLEKQMAMLDSVIHSKSSDKGYPLISTINVKEVEFNHYLELQGNVQTKQNVLVYPEMAGTLVQIYVTEGERVQKNQILAKIDNGGMVNQLAQLKAQLGLAKTTFERQKNLWDQEVGSEIQFLQAKTAYEAQKEAVNQIEATMDKFNIRAPFSGIVDNVIKEEGTVVAPGPGAEIFRVINLSRMYVEVPVPETYITAVTVGKSVKVFFPVLGDTIITKVKQTGNFIDPANRSFIIEIDVPNQSGRIKPNLMAKVQINDYKNAAAILVPQSIISENAEGEQYAYIAVNKDAQNIATAKRSIISTGKSQGDFIEVLSGIKPGQAIITEGARSVRDDQKVKILNSKL
ncbi:MAG: membrane fusion protein (multidrug efflux system) [Marivirga sp.]|jgi:membrane fusion protein (multidrug efflux system)